MKTYDRILDGKQYSFRLTALAQKEMERKFKAPAMQIMFQAVDDIEKMTYLLGVAANYKGNDNPTTDGDDIYNLLVDDGVCGQDGFFEVACKIAIASGIMSEDFAGKTVDAIKKELDSIISSIGEGKDPTKAVEAMAEQF